MTELNQFYDFEQAIIKIWVLLNNQSFGKNSASEEKALLLQIKKHFLKDGWTLSVSLAQDIDDINSRIIDLNKAANINLISIVSKYYLETDKFSNSHKLYIGKQILVYPDPPIPKKYEAF